MTTIVITTNARCKHCKFLGSFKKGKRRFSKCNNPISERYEQQITLRDLVCSSWGI